MKSKAANLVHLFAEAHYRRKREITVLERQVEAEIANWSQGQPVMSDAAYQRLVGRLNRLRLIEKAVGWDAAEVKA